MAPLLAPYNNAMRLGQGFNSYTQQICLNDAVMQPSKLINEPAVPKPSVQPKISPAGETLPVTAGTSGDTQAQTSNHVATRSVSQIVSYSSRFVEKLSDITDAMNISASLSIKTATIGGAASGSFIDSDKFKESDMNFFVQVKVVNQVLTGEDYTEFQNILPVGANFNEVYGDTFISGFEEGGELNALISVKVSDKSKTFAIKAELEATLGTPALSGAVKGGVDMNKSEMKSSTETTVTVNWSGGGQIKPTDAIWDVNSLTLASANFPELVAKTPQKTYAILSKYTTLKSFLKIYKPSSVLTYENAGVYTSALLDTYMDYKSIWKQIQVANFELRNRRADIRIGKPSEEVRQLAAAKKEVDQKKKQDDTKAGSPSQADTVESKRGVATLAPALITDAQGMVTLADTPQPEAGNQDTNTKKEKVSGPEIADMIDFEPYPATVMGLDRARRDCRNEMIKIVNEVDCVTTHPELALDLRRESRFVSPRVFTQLLPVVTLRTVETDNPDSNLNPKSLVILGETNEAPQLQQWLYNRMGNPDCPQPFPAMLASLDRHKTRSKKFDMGDDWCGVVDPGKTALFSNCLDGIDESWIPKSIGIWVLGELIIGLKVFYTNGLDIPHGECSGHASGSIDIRDGEAFSVIQLTLEAAEPPNSTARVTGLQTTFNTCKNQEYPALGRPVDKHHNRKTTTLSQPTNGFWSFRGFWAATAPYKGGFLALGAVWGLDDAVAHSPRLIEGEPTVPSGPDYQMFLGRAMPEDALKSAQEYRSKAGKFSMSNYIGTAKIEKDKFTYFNDLDRVKESWRIKSVTFYKDDDALTGYIINYFDGEPIQRGRVPSGQLGDEGSKKPQRWVTVELELGEHSIGEAPVICGVTLMDISNERYTCRLRDSVVIGDTTISQPDSSWCVVGFWGYYNRELKVLSHLGLVWMNV